MKFTATDALQDLKAQFTSKGKTLKLSDRTISDTLENLMSFATDETELVSFSASAFKTLDSMNGNHIKDTSDFVKTWNEAHPAATPPPTPPITAPVEKPDPLADMRKMIEMMETLTQEVSGIKTKTRTESLIQSAGDLFNAKKPHPQWKGLQDKAKNTVNRFITADMTAESLAAEYDKEFNELVSASGGEGAYIPADNISTGAGAREGTKEFYAIQRKVMEEAGVIKKDD